MPAFSGGALLKNQMGSASSPPSRLQMCQLYMVCLQVIFGGALPVLLHLCTTTPAAARSASDQEISGGNPRFRRLRQINRLLCSPSNRALPLAVILPLAAAVLVLLSDVFAPTHQQPTLLTPSNLVVEQQ